MGAALDGLYEQLRYAWASNGQMGDAARALVAAMTPEVEAELIEELAVTGDAYPVEGYRKSPSQIRSFYLERGRRFHALVDLAAKRRAVGAVPALRLLLLHSAPEVRAAAMSALVEIGDPDGVAEVEALVADSTAPGDLGVWLQLRLRDAPAVAYTAITERIARLAEADAHALRKLALADIARTPTVDPRWCDLAAAHLADWGALGILVRARDRRALPKLRTELESPSAGTVAQALEQLKLLVDASELVAFVEPIYETSYQADVFDQVLGADIAALSSRRAANREAALRGQSHPFLFFGAQPGDWYEGANLGYGYLVRFATVLDGARRDRVRDIFAARRERGLDVDLALLWGDLDGATWLEVTVGGDPFATMRDVFVSMHADVPIREVIFMNQREESTRDDWTAWSHLQPTAARRVPLLRPNIALDRIFYFAGRECVRT